MFAAFHKLFKHRGDGFTLIELVVVLAILGILIALAVPRYLSARKKAYKSEGDNLLLEAKSLEWAYYQQYNSFDFTAGMPNLGFTMPGGAHWNTPSVNGNGQLITMVVSGLIPPLGATDSLWLTLSGDGSSTGGATF